MAEAWGRGTEVRYNKFVEVLAPLNMCVRMYAIFEYKQVIQLLPCHVSDIMQTALLITITLVWTQVSKHYKSVMFQKTHTLGILTQDLGQYVTLATRSFRLRFIQLQVSTDRSQLKQRGQTKNGLVLKSQFVFGSHFRGYPVTSDRSVQDWLIKLATWYFDPALIGNGLHTSYIGCG